MINNYITFLTFIPWIIIFIITSLKNLTKELSFKYLFKNFFKIFRFDTLFLIIVFFYFASFNKDFVNKYLFTVINIYLCVNSIYEPKPKFERGFFKKNILNLIILLLFLIAPPLLFLIFNNLLLSYIFMLLFLFFDYLFIFFISSLSSFFSHTLS